MEPKKDEEFVSRREFCQMLRVSRRVFYKLCKLGLPRYQMMAGSDYRIPKKRAMEWYEKFYKGEKIG